MSTLLPEQAAVPVNSGEACPSWCTAVHEGGASPHWSPQAQLSNPRPLPGASPVMLRAELYYDWQGGRASETLLYLQAEGDIDLTADEADTFIAQAQAFVDTLRALRRQMN